MTARALISDVGGVLIQFDPTVFEREMALVLGTTPEIIAGFWGEHGEEERLFRAFMRGDHEPEAIRLTLERQFGIPLRNDDFYRIWISGLLGMYEETIRLLDEVRTKQSVPLVSCTDVDPVFRDHLYGPKGPLKGFFDAEVRSCDLRVAKPHGAMYETAVERARAGAQNCVFIDDVERNVEGANQCGLRGIHHTPGDTAGLETKLASHGFSRT
ncbi:MAG: HAD-IA family hydrolase [bacterium]|nr:HAD-IA family hydrolase [bacterium]